MRVVLPESMLRAEERGRREVRLAGVRAAAEQAEGAYCALIPTFLSLVNLLVSASVQVKTSGKGSTGAGFPPSSSSSLNLAETEKERVAMLERSC